MWKKSPATSADYPESFRRQRFNFIKERRKSEREQLMQKFRNISIDQRHEAIEDEFNQLMKEVMGTCDVQTPGDINIDIEEWERMKREFTEEYLLLLSEIDLDEKRLQQCHESEDEIVCPFCKHGFWKARHMNEPSDQGPFASRLAPSQPTSSRSESMMVDSTPDAPINTEMLLVCDCGFKMRTRNTSLSTIKKHLDSVLRYHQDNCNEIIQFLVMESSDDMGTTPNHGAMREEILIAGRDHVVATCTRCLLTIEIL